MRRPWRVSIISHIANLITRAPKRVVSVAILFSALSGWYGATHLTLDANTDSLISPDRAFMQTYRSFMREFGDLEYLYIAVDARGNPSAARDAVDALCADLRGVEHLAGVYCRIDHDEQLRLAPRAMSTDELKTFLQASDGFESLLVPNPADLNSVTLLASVHERLGRLQSGGMLMTPQERERIGAGSAFLLRAITAQPGDGFALAQEGSSEYLISSSGKMYFVAILPTKDFGSLATIEPILKDIRRVISDVQRRCPSVDIGLTGKPVLQADELRTTNDDMTRGTVVAGVLVAIMTMWTMGSIVRPLCASIMLLLAFACTYGAAALFVGRLNLLSLVFMLVLVSAGVDYGIHMIARYTEFRQRLTTIPAMRAAVMVNTIPTWVGALTSAAVFFLALGTEFGGLQELGIIAGCGLIACALILTIALPALIVTVDRWRDHRSTHRGVTASHVAGAIHGGRFSQAFPGGVRATPFGSTSPRNDRRVLLGSVCVTLGLAAATPFLTIETNLLRLQADGLDSIAWEHRILEDSVSASWFGAVICRSEAEVMSITNRAKADPLVAQVQSVLDIVKPDTDERTSLRQLLGVTCELRAEPAGPAVGTTSPRPMVEHVAEVGDRLGQLIELASLTESKESLHELRSIALALSALQSRLRDPEQMNAAQLQCDKMLLRTRESLIQMGQGARASLRDSLPAAVRARMISPQGGMLVSVYPRHDLWEFEPLTAFVHALLAIDPDATGVPITVYESVVDMRRAFVTMSLWSLVVIALLVLLDLRSVVATGACLLCLVIGLGWTFGLLALLGVSLNLANFFSVPMLIGFGMDSSVHVMHRAREGSGARYFGWTTRAVVLSAGTTGVGFGTLLFASHRGLQSLGWVMLVGSMASLVTSVVLLPAMLRHFPRLLGLTAERAASTSAQSA